MHIPSMTLHSLVLLATKSEGRSEAGFWSTRFGLAILGATGGHDLDRGEKRVTLLNLSVTGKIKKACWEFRWQTICPILVEGSYLPLPRVENCPWRNCRNDELRLEKLLWILGEALLDWKLLPYSGLPPTPSICYDQMHCPISNSAIRLQTDPSSHSQTKVVSAIALPVPIWETKVIWEERKEVGVWSTGSVWLWLR